MVNPAKLTVGTVRTDEGRKFEGDFAALLTEHGIRHEVTAPDTPRFNGVAERAFSLQSEKTIAILETSKEAGDKILWAEAMNFACVIGNYC